MLHPQEVEHNSTLVKCEVCIVVYFQPVCNPMDYSLPGSSVHGISQARILEWGCHFLLQGIFLTQGSNTHLLHWPTDSLPMSHQGSRARDDTPFLVSSREFIFEIWCCLGEIQGCPLSNGIWISFAGSGSSQH